MDILDFMVVYASFGSSTGDATFNPIADTDGNGTVDINDVMIVIQNFNKTCN